MGWATGAMAAGCPTPSGGPLGGPGAMGNPVARIACTSLFTRVRCRTTWLRRAMRRRSVSVRLSGSQTPGKKPAARSAANTPASILSVFTCAWAIAFTCRGLAMTTRATCGRDTRTTAMTQRHAIAGGLDDHFIRRLEAAPKALEARACHVDAAAPAKPAVLPKHRLRERAVQIQSNHSSHSSSLHSWPWEPWAARQLRIRARGASGWVALRGLLTASPSAIGSSASWRMMGGQLLTQARSTSNTSACPRFILPAPRSPDGRTIRETSKSLAGYLGTTGIVPVTNAIEALNSKLRRAVRTRGHFPNDDSARKLLFLVLSLAEQERRMPPRERAVAKAQFAILFEERPRAA